MHLARLDDSNALVVMGSGSNMDLRAIALP